MRLLRIARNLENYQLPLDPPPPNEPPPPENPPDELPPDHPELLPPPVYHQLLLPLEKPVTLRIIAIKINIKNMPKTIKNIGIPHNKPPMPVSLSSVFSRVYSPSV